MAALSATGFAVLVWGVIGLVLAVFAYQLVAVARDFDLA